MRGIVACLLVALLLVPSVAGAAEPGPLASSVDDQIGSVRDDLQSANATYGDRSEFRQARFELAQAASMLVLNATILAEENLIDASGAVATGRLRAQAAGSANPSQDVVDRAAQIAAQADGLISQVRNDLISMERGGLEPVAFDGGLAVAHTLLRAMDLRQTHRIAMQDWENGDHSAGKEAQVVTTAIGSLRIAGVARDTLAKVAELRQDAPISPSVTSQELERLTDARHNWSKAHRSSAVSQSAARLDAFHERGDKLLTLASYLVFFQAQARVGLELEYRQGKTDAVATAHNLYNLSNERIDAWIEFLDIPADIPKGAMASGRVHLDFRDNATRDQAAQKAATAAGLFHLAEEHLGLLQEGLANVKYTPGQGLAEPQVYEPEDWSPPLWLIGAGLAALIAAAVYYVRRGS